MTNDVGQLFSWVRAFNEGMMSPRPLKILRIGLVQGDRVVEERLVRERRDVTIGQSTKNTLVVPMSNALPRSFTLFERSEQGYVLRVPERVDGRVFLSGEVATLAALREKHGTVDGISRVPLDDDTRGTMLLGDVRVLFQLVAPPPVQPRPRLPASVRGSFLRNLDGMFTAVIGGSFVLHLAMMIYLHHVDFPRTPDIEALPDTWLHVTAPRIDKPKKPEPEKSADVVVAANKKTVRRPAGAVPATPKPAALPRENLQDVVRNQGVLRILNGRDSDGNGTLVDMLTKGQPSGDADAVFRNVGGVDVSGPTNGSTRPRGASGPGSIRGGNELRVNGPGTIATGDRAFEQRVRERMRDTAPSEADDFPDATLLAKEIKARIRGITACYEAGMRNNPNLGGKLELRIDLSAIGKVTKVEVAQDTMKDEGVETCIKNRVLTWRLTPPPGGAAARFAYPFVFQRAQ